MLGENFGEIDSHSYRMVWHPWKYLVQSVRLCSCNEVDQG